MISSSSGSLGEGGPGPIITSPSPSRMQLSQIISLNFFNSSGAIFRSVLSVSHVISQYLLSSSVRDLADSFGILMSKKSQSAASGGFNVPVSIRR